MHTQKDKNPQHTLNQMVHYVLNFMPLLNILNKISSITLKSIQNKLFILGHLKLCLKWIFHQFLFVRNSCLTTQSHGSLMIWTTGKTHPQLTWRHGFSTSQLPGGISLHTFTTEQMNDNFHVIHRVVKNFLVAHANFLLGK